MEIKKNAELEKEQQQLDFYQGKYHLNLFKFEEEEEKYLREIKEKSVMLVNKQYEHHDNMNKQENQEKVQNDELLKANIDLIKKIKSNVRQEAGNIVLEEKELNENRNYELKAKLLELRDELEKLKKERNNILKTRNEHKINQSLNEEEMEEYKVVGSLQKAKIKAHKEKVEAMKKTISSEISKLEEKIKEKKKQRESELRGSKIKLFNIEKNKEEMKAKIEKYKLLADTILLQREEVEEFFLLAIETCKQQMDTYEGPEHPHDRQYGEKVDIEELLPKDKHRIITNLYTKLALAPK